MFGVVWSHDDSVYGGYGANQAFVLLEEHVLVFDTGFTNIQAKSLTAEIRKITTKKIKYIVNSHDHSDHVFGNSIIMSANPKDMTVISQQTCRRRLLKLGRERLDEYRSRDSRLERLLRDVSITLPQVTYSDLNVKLNLEGTDIFLVHPETGAHTLGDTILMLPQKKVMLAGDVIWNRFLPNLEDADLEGWIQTLKDVDLEGYSHVLPGHGKICGKKEVLTFRNYLQQVLENLRQVSNESGLRDLQKCFEIEGTEKWKMRQIVNWNIEKVLGRAV